MWHSSDLRVLPLSLKSKPDHINISKAFVDSSLHDEEVDRYERVFELSRDDGANAAWAQ